MLHYLQNLFQAMDFSSLTDAVLRVAAVFLCLTIHETCHGLAALALGDPTAKSMHRLSLNPLRHIDWFGLALKFVAGFGWAKPVPVNPNYFRKPKQGMAITALAGPISNILLAILSFGHQPGHLSLRTLQRWNEYAVQLVSIHRGADVGGYGDFQPDSSPTTGWVQGSGSSSAG